MTSDLNGDGILADANFRTLAFSKTSLEEFTNLVETHVAGWTQRRKLADGLKEFKTKVEAAETKMKVVKNVGKAKSLDPEEEALCKHYDSFDLADKSSSLTKAIQAQLGEGRVTAEERPVVLQHLRTRLAAAKEGGKDALAEKLDKQMDAVVKAKPIELPVTNLSEIFEFRKRLQDLERLGKRPPKTLDREERQRLAGKAQVESEASSLEYRSRMWFENEFEFQPRMERALVELAKIEAEALARAEEEAKEKQRLAEEQAIQERKLEAARKEEEAHKQLMEKLEAKRLEASAKPQKEVPVAKPKPKKRVIKLDNHDLFQAPVREDTPEASPEASDDEAALAAATAEAEAAKAAAAEAAAKAEASRAEAAKARAEATKAKAPVPKPQPPRAPKPVLENKWGAPPQNPFLSEAAEDDGPSLADALAAPKAAGGKKQAPPAAKKEKPTFTRMDPQELFQPPPREDSDNDLRALPATSVEDSPLPEPTPQPTPAPKEAPTPEAAPEPVPEPTPEPKPKPAPRPKVVLENKWDNQAPAPEASDEAAEDLGPSLADAVAAKAAPAKKVPAPQPKKKEKKKFTKVSAASLGFDCDNPNY